MVITGAGPGIMEAGIDGAGADRAFGVNIVLPFEQEASPLIAGDPKLINYRYFFTRKLTFMKESHAFALLPGGFGTMDEGFELLTLMQTGRTAVVPVVLLAEPGSTYWSAWLDFVHARARWPRPDLRRRPLPGAPRRRPSTRRSTRSCGFYSTYHSMRFVGRRLVMRLTRELTDAELAGLDGTSPTSSPSGGFERVAASASEIEDGDVARSPPHRLPLRSVELHPPPPPHRPAQRP